MKAKIKYQEVDYIQYNGTNREQIDVFVGMSSIGEYKGNKESRLLPTLIFNINSEINVVLKGQYIVRTSTRDMIVIDEQDFSKLFEPVNS